MKFWLVLAWRFYLRKECFPAWLVSYLWLVIIYRYLRFYILSRDTDSITILLSDFRCINLTMSFVIVRFVEENGAPAIVASNSDGTLSYYPNVRSAQAKEKLLKRKVPPDSAWSQYPVKILHKYEFYGDARLHLKAAEETSNLDSDDENDRPRKRRSLKKIIYTDDESSSDDMCNVQLKKTPKCNTLEYPLVPQIQSTVVNDCIQPNSSWISASPSTQIESCNDGINVTPSSSRNVNFKSITCPAGCNLKKFQVQLATLTQLVTDLSEGLNRVEEKVNSILSQTENTARAPNQNDNWENMEQILSCLPVSNDDSFMKLNEDLKESQNRKVLIRHLGVIGGKNVQTLTTNMLKRIMVDDVAELYSLTGKQRKDSSKKSFLQTESCKIIFQVCQKMFADSTETTLREVISDWLNQAKVRNTRRAERQQRKNDAVNNIG